MSPNMTSKDAADVVIIGAGQAGGTAASTLRMFGFEGPIMLVGEEADPPYQRPPLSKAYLKGEMDRERLYIKPAEYYAEHDIVLKLGEAAQAIDTDAKTVTLVSGGTISYGKLIIATGSRARMVPVLGADLEGVQVLRTLADVDLLKPRVEEGKSLVVIGAGYIGLEAAAAARQLGLEVTVLEAADRVLGRVTSPEISKFYQNEHAAQGVDVRLNARMSEFVGGDGKLTGVKMDDGSVIPADIALVGIGILPNQEIASDAGIVCENGIKTDENACTSDKDVYAIGDCAGRPLAHYGRDGRLESVHNALEQAKLAVAAIVGKPQPKLEAPWFWSDQYDLKLQTAGLLTGYMQAVVRGDTEARKFAVWYLDENGVFLAVDAINSPPDFLCGKKLVGQGAKLDASVLRDPDTDIKQLTKDALAG